MKFLFIIVFMLTPMFGFAQNIPKIGDTALYESIEVRGSETSYLEEEVRFLQDYRPETDEFEVWRSELEPAFWITRELLMNTLYIQNLNEYCAQSQNSRIERITVPAGSFNTCRTELLNPSYKQILWVSDEVPFALVKLIYEYKHGMIATETLLQYKRGTGQP